MKLKSFSFVLVLTTICLSAVGFSSWIYLDSSTISDNVEIEITCFDVENNSGNKEINLSNFSISNINSSYGFEVDNVLDISRYELTFTLDYSNIYSVNNNFKTTLELSETTSYLFQYTSSITPTFKYNSNELTNTSSYSNSTLNSEFSFTFANNKNTVSVSLYCEMSSSITSSNFNDTIYSNITTNNATFKAILKGEFN